MCIDETGVPGYGHVLEIRGAAEFDLVEPGAVGEVCLREIGIPEEFCLVEPGVACESGPGE